MTASQPQAPLPPSVYVCRQCREPLHRITAADGVDIWHHRDRHDHSEQPVPALETTAVSTVCDFCSSPNPPWVYPVDAGQYQASGFTVSVTVNSDGWWTACDRCADLIDRGRRDDLARASAARLRDHSANYRQLPPKLARRLVEESQSGFWSQHPGGRHLLTLPHD